MQKMKWIAVLSLLPGLVMAAERPSFKPKIEMEYRFLAPTELEKEQGGFGFDANKLKLSNLFADVSYERWQLNWQDIDLLPSGLSDGQASPVKTMHAVALSGKYMHRFNQRQLWLNTAGVSLTYEQQTRDAMSVNLMSMLIHQLDQAWSIVYGAMLSYHPVRSRALPVAGFSYRMHAPLGWSGTLGYPRSYVAYGLSPQWQISGGVVYNTVLAKLAQDSVIEQDGYGEINAWQSDVALKYQPNSRWSLQTSLRFSPLYEFTSYDAEGDRQQTYNMQPTWGAAFSASYQF